MTDFRFENPAVLLALGLVPIFQVVLSRIHLNAREKLLRFVSEENLQSLLLEKSRSGKVKPALFWLGLALMIVALARPQANPTVEERESANLDIYVLLDVSKSMDAEDVAPSRLKKAKRSVHSLTQLLSGDRLGVIAFAGSAVMVSPLTADYEVVDTFLQNVDTSLIQNQGTDIGLALEMAEEAMQRGAEKTGEEGARSNVFLVMSDGEDHEQQSWEAAKRIREQGGVVFAIAFGTEQGSTIPVRNERGELAGQKRDRSGNPVITAVQPRSLQEIAAQGGGQFYFSTPAEEEIRDILRRMQGMGRGSAAVMRAKVYQELFPPVLAAGLLVLVWSFVSLKSLLFRLPRKGVALLLLLPWNTEAAITSYLWDNEKRAFEQSQELAEAGKPEEAVDKLKGLLAEDPDNPGLNYNVGTYLLEGKKGEDARKQLQRLVERENPLRERALFNIAGSFAQEGKKAEARAAYGELLRSLQGRQDPTSQELQELTRKNLARLSEESQQQKPQEGQQNQGQQGGSGEQEKKENKSPQGNQGQQGDEQKQEEQKKKEEQKNDQGQGEQEKKEEQKNNQGQQGEDGKQPPPQQPMAGRRPFRERDNMGEEEAKRILEALGQRESGLQKRFLKNKDNKGFDNDSGKDW